MKLLFISDLHNHGLNLSKEEFESFDIFIILGDCTKSDLEVLKDIDKPKIGIHGNWDALKENEKDYFDELGIVNLHLKTFEHEGMSFLGFDGNMKYAFAEEFPEKYIEETKELERLQEMPKVNILFSHYPSFRVLDKFELSHRGLKAFNNYIKAKQPDYHIHGHIHHEAREQIGNTKVIRIFQSFKLDI